MKNRFTEFDPRTHASEPPRVIGGGSLGGKAKGLIFAREVTAEVDSHSFGVCFPESWHIGTDVFEEFSSRVQVENPECHHSIKEAYAQARLPESLMRDLEDLLQSARYPLAVRSSSYLEDSMKHSFAGKYLTLFIPNSGDLAERLRQLETAIKLVYASTYNPNAVSYRKKHNLPEEKMGVIVQRLIGKQRGNLFYPEVSGVGYSKNYRRWTERVAKEDGVVRIAFGLGTRCTGRGYARTFSLTNLALRPEGYNPEDIAKYSQETFDALDMETGQLVSYNINRRLETISHHPRINRFAEVFSQSDRALLPLVPGMPLTRDHKLIFTFHGLQKSYPEIFVHVHRLFDILEKAMGMAVDIEFVFEARDSSFFLVQARPLTSYEEYSPVIIPKTNPANLILRGNRMLTNGRCQNIRYIVYVDYREYQRSADKYEVAREIGRINRSLEGERYILVGPGRWGSRDKLLGVPVVYNEISNAGVLVELGFSRENFVPELSYGTHFFADLEADGVLYMPVFDHLAGNVINFGFFARQSDLTTFHPAVSVFTGRFSAYFSGDAQIGVVIDDA